MPLFRQTPPLPDEPIFRWILYVLVGSTVVAAIIAIGAEQAWGLPVLSRVAGWSAITTGLLYLVFRWLGAREMAKRAARGAARQEDDPDA